jgi:pyrimidine deaminase RibD-like protein
MDRNYLVAGLIVATSIVGLGYFGLAMKRIHAETVNLIQAEQVEQAAQAKLMQNRSTGVYDTQWYPVALTDNFAYVIEQD